MRDGRNLTNKDDDRANFFARRIREYEQNVRLLATRLFDAVPGDSNLHSNVGLLLEISCNIRARLQNRSLERGNLQTEVDEEKIRTPVERSDNQGRPQAAANTSHANELRQLGFTWTDISQMLGCLHENASETPSSIWFF